MALDSGSLADGLTAVFDGRDGFPKTAQAAGAAWASAYRQYADPIFTAAVLDLASELDQRPKAWA